MSSRSSIPSGNSRHALLAAILLGTIVVCYALFFFLPVQRKINAAQRELQEKQLHIVQASNLQLPMQQSQVQLRHVETYTTRLEERLPSTTADFLKTFSRISEQAKLAGVVVRRFDPLPATKMKSLQQANLEITLEGTFPQLMDFLSRVEELPHVIWASNVSLGKIEGPGGLLLSEITLTIFGNLADQGDFNGQQ